jgi:hypothetical protein
MRSSVLAGSWQRSGWRTVAPARPYPRVAPCTWRPPPCRWRASSPARWATCSRVGVPRRRSATSASLPIGPSWPASWWRFLCWRASSLAPLAQMFGLAPLGSGHWLLLACFGPALLGLEELRKRLRRSLKRPDIPAPPQGSTHSASYRVAGRVNGQCQETHHVRGLHGYLLTMHAAPEASRLLWSPSLLAGVAGVLRWPVLHSVAQSWNDAGIGGHSHGGVDRPAARQRAALRGSGV